MVSSPLGAAAAVARERRIGWLCAAFVLLIWLAFQISGRLSVRQALTPWDVAGLRYLGALVGVLPLLWRRGLPRLPPFRAAVLVALSAFGFPLGAYVGFSLAPVAQGAVILFGALPIATALLGAALFGMRVPGAQMAALPVIAAGILLTAAQSGLAGGPAWGGDLCFLAAVSCLAAFTLLLRRWAIGALEAMLTLSVWGLPLYLPFWIWVLPSHLARAPLGAEIYQAVVQGPVTAVLAMFLYSRAVNALGSGPPTLVAALVPGLASVLAWGVLGERLGGLGVAGVALATAGMLAGVLGPRMARRAAVVAQG
jgi:drug/metabolite transporter (DMT)-like permease